MPPMGAIGHWVSSGTPSIQGVLVCKTPCQWIASAADVITLDTSTTTLSPLHTFKEKIRKVHTKSRMYTVLFSYINYWSRNHAIDGVYHPFNSISSYTLWMQAVVLNTLRTIFARPIWKIETLNR